MPNDTYEILTPEQVKITYSLAGIGSRGYALFIDMLIQVAALIVFLIGYIRSGAYDAMFSSAYAAFTIVMLFVIFFVYFIIFETALGGRTPGKMAAGIRVIYTNGRPCSFYGALMRNLFRMLDFLPAFYGAGIVAMFVSANARRVGDYVAGTVVVIDRKTRRKVPLSIDAIIASRRRRLAQTEAGLRSAGGPPVTAAAPPAPSARKNTLTPGELSVIGDYFRRRDKLGRSVRDKLAQTLAEPLYRRLGIERDARRLPDEDFLRRLYEENRE